jgi:hypothetical protein
MILPDFFYAQVIKQRKRFRLVDVVYRHVWGLPTEYRSRLKAEGLSGNINTSFVERINLTLRQGVSKLTRRTWGTAQFSSELTEHIYWWLAYYHFSRFHESLRIKLDVPILRKGKQRAKEYRKVTPAVAAGLTRKRWSVMELVSYPLPCEFFGQTTQLCAKTHSIGCVLIINYGLWLYPSLTTLRDFALTVNRASPTLNLL